MVGVVVAILVAILPAIVIAESVVKYRRRADWLRSNKKISEDEFFISLGSIQISRDLAIRMRTDIADATKIPANLISADHSVDELDSVRRGPREIIDYFTDFLFVEEPKDEEYPITVRDLIVLFGPQLQKNNK